MFSIMIVPKKLQAMAFPHTPTHTQKKKEEGKIGGNQNKRKIK